MHLGILTFELRCTALLSPLMDHTVRHWMLLKSYSWFCSFFRSTFHQWKNSCLSSFYVAGKNLMTNGHKNMNFKNFFLIDWHYLDVWWPKPNSIRLVQDVSLHSLCSAQADRKDENRLQNYSHIHYVDRGYLVLFQHHTRNIQQTSSSFFSL